jgi:transposase
MTKSYSLDLRRRVARFVEAGHSCHAAARHFEVSVAFVVRLMAAYRATGSLAPMPEGGWRYSKLDPHRDFLIQRVDEKGEITMPQNSWPSAPRSRPLRSRTGSAARATASKKTLRASEQGRTDVRQAREHWRTKRQPRMRRTGWCFGFAALRVSMRPAPRPR